MRTSIKLKFSLFLAVLLLLTVLLLSMQVLEGIKRNQQVQYERYLAQQAKTANSYFLQNVMTESVKVPQAFLASKGRAFAEQLELISGQGVVLYDVKGQVVSDKEKAAPFNTDGIKKTLAFALENKTAYLAEGESLYYLTPLKAGNEQVGVIQFYYSLSDNLAFYNEIRQLFIFVGSGVFLISFALAYLYFAAFANGIIKLNQAVNRIREGHYQVAILSRRDEIGRLSEGIHAMSGQIMRTLRAMEEEQEKLKLAVDKLSRLDKQQKQFIGSVSHEFKTPLTSIKAYIDLLEMYPDDESLLETAKTTIKNESQRLYEMVEKVLQLSALEKYDFEFVREKLEISRIIQTVLDGLKGKMDKFGIRLETDLSQAFIEVDKDSITLILMNLLDNAVKYNKPRGLISVKSRTEGTEVIIEIADTGIGIPPDAAQRIFDPFYTVDKNRSRQNGGVGLGLALAQKYAQIQGGSITLLETGAEGSLFRVIFPSA